jgi:hypothetical protein
MDTAAQVLLIIVSSVLSIFLIFMIVAIYYLIGIFKHIRKISSSAENVAESVESAAAAFERGAKPLAILKIISNIMDQAGRARRRKG